MKANELRIGNFVHLTCEGHEHEPDTFDWELDDFDFYADRFENIKPIPLTEEWILKFGFIRDEYNCLILDLENYSRANLYFDKKNGLLKLMCKNNLWLNSGDCIYVHQLQNLYFALTGEELTID